MKKIYIITLLIIFCFSACKEQTEEPKQEIEYLLFGHFYGFCVGEQCIEIFKLTEDGLYEDTIDQYPNSERVYKGNFTKLDDAKFELVRSIVDDVPAQLLSEQDTIIGVPDASDGGGVYFAIRYSNGTRYWLIDQFDHNLPDYIIPFKNQINNTISLIND